MGRLQARASSNHYSLVRPVLSDLNCEKLAKKPFQSILVSLNDIKIDYYCIISLGMGHFLKMQCFTNDMKKSFSQTFAQILNMHV